jgi:hypothetical protein
MIASFNEAFTIRSIRIGLSLTLDNIKSNDSYKFNALVRLIKSERIKERSAFLLSVPPLTAKSSPDGG